MSGESPDIKERYRAVASGLLKTLIKRVQKWRGGNGEKLGSVWEVMKEPEVGGRESETENGGRERAVNTVD